MSQTLNYEYECFFKLANRVASGNVGASSVQFSQSLGLRGCVNITYTARTVNDVLVNPYPFNAVKRVWIDQDIIDSPHCSI